MSNTLGKRIMNAVFINGTEEEVAKVKASLGKIIGKIQLFGNYLLVGFEGESKKLKLWDNGQSCCENRYMTTDEKDLDYYIGATLIDVEVRDAETQNESGYDIHEIQFLTLITNRGNITFSNHNEHNGYYGGFSVAAELV
jgi:hypothetical protein